MIVRVPVEQELTNPEIPPATAKRAKPTHQRRLFTNGLRVGTGSKNMAFAV
ncbi:MAG: hypothetical protein JWR69_2248 [Pedosphaera sp.]|nr:hypothetical protein [Pedosphaera sp.]